LSKQVTLTRKRLIEEKIVHEVNAANPEEAIAATKQLIRSNKLNWKYTKTLQEVPLAVDVKEVKFKRGDGMGGPIKEPEPVETPATETPTTAAVPVPFATEETTHE
jgi:hypothetical protein